jgi:secreted trypsin-like serine protease
VSSNHRLARVLSAGVLLLSAPGLVAVTWDTGAFAAITNEIDIRVADGLNGGEAGQDQTQLVEEESPEDVTSEERGDGTDSGTPQGVSAEEQPDSEPPAEEREVSEDDFPEEQGGDVDQGTSRKPMPGISSFILWGEEASIQQAPWQVALLISNPALSQAQAQFCGGTIIDPEWIVTAAHCLERPVGSLSNIVPFEPKDIRVLAGQTALDTSRASTDGTRLVKELIQHPEWDDIEFGYDVGLIRLETPLTLNGQTIDKVPYSSLSPRHGTRGLVTGWGVFDFALEDCPVAVESVLDLLFCINFYDLGVSPLALQSAQNVVLSERDCRRWWDRLVPSVMSQGFCGDPPRRQGGFACSGDSGGPFVSSVSNQRLLYGIVSFGVRDCLSLPAVYQDVAKVSGWIQQETGVEAGLQQALVSATGATRPVQGGSNVRLGLRGGSGRGGAFFQLVGDATGCTLTQQGRNWVLSSTELTQCEVVGTKAAEGLFASATASPLTVSFTVPRRQANLLITNSRDGLVGTVGSPLIVTTRGGSIPGGATSVEVLSGACSVDAGRPMQVTASQAGACRIQARMEGSGVFGDAISRPVNLSFRGPQPELFILNDSSGIPSTTAVRLAVVGGAGSGRVSYELNSGDCRLSRDTLRALSANAACTVTATKASSGVFSSVSSDPVTFTFAPAD